MLQSMFIKYLIHFLRDPGAVHKLCAWVPGVKDAAGTPAGRLSLILGKAQSSVKRTGRAARKKLKSMYNPHTLIGG